VTDFGLAKKLDEPGLSRPGDAPGTPNYMAPEQVNPAVGPPGPVTDVYGVGAILYESLTGRPPFQAPEVLTVLQQVLEQEPVPVRRLQPGVPRDLETICHKCLRKEPARRYASARELAEDLRRFHAGEPIRARPVGRLERGLKWVRRRPAQAALLGTVLVVLLGGMGLVLWLWQEDQARVRRTLREVNAALQETAELRGKAETKRTDPALWKAALMAALRAEAALGSGQADEDTRRRVQALRAELEVRWQDAKQAAAQAGKDRRLLLKLEEARLQAAAGKKSSFDNRGASARYAQAFQEDGLNLLRLPPREVARRLKGRAIKAQILAALDDWAEITLDAKLQPRLLRMIAVLDPNPDSFRSRWRNARGNRQLLTRLASAPQVRQLSPADLARLGRSLTSAKAVREAVDLLQKAWSKHPHDFWINFYLAGALAQLKKPRWGEVSRFYTAALAVRPGSAVAFYNLGAALKAQGDLKGAVVAYRKAVEINPQFADAFNNLGITLAAQRDLKGAVVAFRRAIHINPKDAEFYYNLGIALNDQRDLKGAIAAYRKVIRLNPSFAKAYVNLGFALQARGDLKGAAVAYQDAIHRDLRDPTACLNLGVLYYQQGEFADALRYLREGANRLSSSDPRRTRLRRAIRQCQRLADLEFRLPPVQLRVEKPASAAEQIEFAELCTRKRKYAAAARFYEQAFAADAKLAEVLNAGDRYAAACAAVLAAAGQGNDTANLSGQERIKWRRQALAWLRADLSLWRKHLGNGKAEERPKALKVLRLWQRDADLAGVRDPKALAKLAAGERADWQQFWREVDALIQKAK
jgi:serine/threonine-protein kinase